LINRNGPPSGADCSAFWPTLVPAKNSENKTIKIPDLDKPLNLFILFSFGVTKIS
jgi:hypothetical protein